MNSAQNAGIRIQQYLEEKLSTSQIHWRVPIRSRAIAYHLTAGRSSSSPWFRVKKVPWRYWNKVVGPGLRQLAKSMGMQLVVVTTANTGSILTVEFYIARDVEE